jgi:6-phosphogluconate dehydrogenase
MKKRYCLIGLGKIGYNLAISLDNKKFNFDFWDIDQIKTKKLSKKLKKEPIINLKNYLKKKGQVIILLLIPHNKINFFIKTNIKYFKKNDAIIDFGNSNPDQTHKLHISLKKKGILFFGIGFSGGVQGAANTPSLMISGKKIEIKKISNLLTTILNNNNINIIGRDPRLGHLSKICHNSIEYGLMKLLGEFYIFQKNILNLPNSTILKNFKKINIKNPDFYLGNLSEKILIFKKNLLNKHIISDKIDHNQTSKWFNILCLENDIIYPTLFASLENRILSQNIKSFNFKKKKTLLKKFYNEYIDLFIFLFFICYIQGILAILTICKIKKIKINLSCLLKVWSKNSIISSNQLNKINHNLSIQKINSLKFFSKKKIVKINSELSNLIKLFLSHQENPTGLFSIFNWLNSHNSSRKNENVFVNILRNAFGNHKLNKN